MPGLGGRDGAQTQTLPRGLVGERDEEANKDRATRGAGAAADAGCHGGPEPQVLPMETESLIRQPSQARKSGASAPSEQGLSADEHFAIF